ncbi:uncharacterized protein [Typha angustifolia]|uniref:uncharacterized protein isoform X2 n=1 Tax=Typha angustifolia TaxID=59011 RepID=UPI003C2E9E34
MEIFEDDDALPLFPEEAASPVPERRLKRLKKASEARVPDPLPTETLDPDPSSTAILGPDPSTSSSPASVSVPDVSSDAEDVAESLGGSESTGKGMGFDDGLDPLFAVPREMGSEREEERDACGTEHFDSTGESEGIGIGGLIEELRREKSAKKRLSLDEEAEEITEMKKKKKSRNKSDDMNDGEPIESAREKKRERKDYLDQIHAESQRLLRETRDASFKPVPPVQKPISSVLGKIRLRKLELMQKSSASSHTDSFGEADYSVGEISQVPNPSGSQKVRGDEIHEKVDEGAFSADVRTCGNCLDQCGSVVENEDPSSNSQGSDENNLIKNSSCNTIDEALSPPVPPSSPKLDLADVSSSEDNDKENIDPYARKAVSMDPYPEGGPVKAFVDDEAEEEDDSDHDLMRFQENEEDDESEENEELNDMIATGFEEGSVDCEKRNELHQKWLEQQDAAETENVLQRLKCGQKPKDPIIEDEEDNEGSGEDFEDETSYDLSPRNTIRQNTIKAKQMIAQMFTDNCDIYVPSDDEEAEKTLVRQRLSVQKEDSSFISPLDDEHSREVFGLIKKLNIAPQPKKRGKVTTSNFEMLMMGGNSNNTKSSFIGRTSNSLASSHKSVTSRTFIFGRDDSNSKSAISSSDNLSDMVQMDNNQPRQASSSNFTSSHLKSAPSRTKSQEDVISGSSLFEILRQSSVSFDRKIEYKSGSSSHLIRETQTANQFSAFKLGRKISKVEERD